MKILICRNLKKRLRTFSVFICHYSSERGHYSVSIHVSDECSRSFRIHKQSVLKNRMKVLVRNIETHTKTMRRFIFKIFHNSIENLFENILFEIVFF